MFDLLKVARRLKDLEEVVTKLNRQWEERDMDWVELRARCRRLLDRTEKAAARVDKGEQTVEDSDPATQSGGEGNGATTTGTLLTPHQKAIQQLILRRRGGL